MRSFIRSSIFAFSLLVCSGVAGAATTVPNIFTAGTPAKAADVNADFAALATAIDTLTANVKTLSDFVNTLPAAVQSARIDVQSARIDKLDGTTPITAADIVGVFQANTFRADVTQDQNQKSEFASVTGTVTINADGTGTIVATEFVAPFVCPFPLAYGTILTGCPDSRTPVTHPFAPNVSGFTWSLSGGQLITSISSVPFSVLAGGRLLVAADHFPGVLSAYSSGFIAQGVMMHIMVKK